MPTDFPDVLDAMGKTPREFGTVHVHFEGFHEVDGKRCVAVVLAQAAFVPCAGATVRVLEGVVELASATLPPLDDGRVVRLKLPCQKASEADTLTLQVDAAEPAPRAARVRQAWKLFDTLEIPKLSDMDPVTSGGGLNVGTSLALTAVTGPLLGVAVLQFGGSTSLAANQRTTVHQAQALPPLTASKLPGVAKPIEQLDTEVLWQVGRPVPEAAPVIPLVQAAAAAPKVALRWCRACGFEGPEAEYARARNCPRCDEPWF